jgi:hypothetical protein
VVRAAEVALSGPQARANDGASRCKQVKPAGASELTRVGARIPSKLVMGVQLPSPAPTRNPGQSLLWDAALVARKLRASLEHKRATMS